MKKNVLVFVLCTIMLLGLLPTQAFAAKNTEDIIILYENDVHCAVEGYAKHAAMKKELAASYAHVGVVSCGDFIQGSSLGVISRGEYIVNIMNLIGYDAVALGNHEFDFRLPRLNELVGMMNTKPICCNFRETAGDKPYFTPYSIVSYGDVDIAYVGITTPSTIKTSSPAQFKDENGEFLYTFSPTTLYAVVQESIDAANAAGADYVIALAHVGDAEPDSAANIVELIQNTDGFDAVLDGHSHSVIAGERVTDKGGNDVLLSSTGTKFAHIGKLTIADGKLSTELIETEGYTAADPDVEAYLNQIEAEHAALGNRKVATGEIDLITHDADGNRLIRKAETNLGDLCADAFRSSLDADIGYINGGGIRAEIPAGEITFNDLLSVFPYNNTLVLAEIDGRTLRDMLEMAMMSWPEEGSFPHVSGLTFSLNTRIPSSVVLNETEEFCGVSGQYRVYDIKVFNRETEKYEPLDLSRTYTIASHNYYLIEHGSGMTMLEAAKVLRNDGMLDVEVLERYITDELGGVIGEAYREAVPNITYTDGEITAAGGPSPAVLIVCVAVLLLAVLILLFFLRRRARSTKSAKA